MLVSNYRKLKSHLLMILVFGGFILGATPLILIFAHVLILGLPAIHWSFFTELPKPTGQVGGGMGHAILGSAIMVAMATIVSAPIGILGGVFIVEYQSGKLTSFFKLIVNLFTSLPSIIVGLFVYSILVLPFKSFSAYAGAGALSIIMIPIVVKTTEESLKLLPHSIREAGLALGLPKYKVILRVVLKSQKSSILTGVLLGLARIAGETAPLLVTAFGNINWPAHLAQPTASLPVQIYSYAISPFNDWHEQAWAGALTLLIIVFGISVISRVLIFRQRVRR